MFKMTAFSLLLYPMIYTVLRFCYTTCCIVRPENADRSGGAQQAAEQRAHDVFT